MLAKDLLQFKTELSTILTEQLPIQVKFRLTRFQKQINDQAQIIFDSRNELILSIEPSGNIPSHNEDGTPNEKLKEFNEAYSKILDEDINIIDIPIVSIKELSEFSTKNNYPKLFELIFIE